MSFIKEVTVGGKTKHKKCVNVRCLKEGQLFIPVINKENEQISTYVGPGIKFTVLLSVYKDNKDILKKIKDDVEVDTIKKVINKVGEKSTETGRTDFLMTHNKGIPDQEYQENKKHDKFNIHPGALDAQTIDEKAHLQKISED